MTNGVFSAFEEEMKLKGKFSKIFTFNHEVEGESVEGVIQLRETQSEYKIEEDRILNCELIDYIQVGRHTRDKDEDTGRYSIKIKYSLVPRLFTFQIINDKFVRTNNIKERPIVIKALSIALGGNKNTARPVHFNMQKLETDFPKHKKSNVKRSGFWQGGTIHGIDIAKDPLLAKEYAQMLKSSITFESGYFEKMNLSVSVSKYGGVSLNLDEGDDISDSQFIEYFINELMDYVVLGKVIRRRRTSSEFE
ncbi:hypothetical protein [Nitrosopumilus sp.]|uniref:hypothetical protein n=1 Tax=Nitrosopumilus sp. TaxID=2024843 RepID=UPI00247D55C9|nr:hypothetical protein [Nitrosopumilus sp.]MCV0431678.1 hypothetical protein [Nitrosopumilus sp.]